MCVDTTPALLAKDDKNLAVIFGIVYLYSAVRAMGDAWKLYFSTNRAEQAVLCARDCTQPREKELVREPELVDERVLGEWFASDVMR